MHEDSAPLDSHHSSRSLIICDISTSDVLCKHSSRLGLLLGTDFLRSWAGLKLSDLSIVLLIESETEQLA